MKELMTWEMFHYAIIKLGEKIKSHKDFKNIYGIPRGGLVVAVALSHYLNIPLIIHEEDITIDTLIVDDISDTGNTLSRYPNNILATIYITNHTKVIPNHYVFTRKSDWVTYPWEILDYVEVENYG
jgi:hypoxanthine phosphoribosyltransferase